MIYCRFKTDPTGEPRYGVVDSHMVQEISGDFFSPYEPVGEPNPFQQVMFLAPVLPTKIVAVGVNYKKHAQEMAHDLPPEPLLFLKPPSAVIGALDPIVCPKESSRVDYEGELAVVIKKRARNISPEQAQDYILGYTCFNDVTARDLQKKDGQWSRAKGFDTFAPIGPWIADEIDPHRLYLETYVNGELKQSSSTDLMIFKVPQLLAYISRAMTLEPGDIVTTGTPEGVGPLKPGDIVDVRIDGIGVLRNPVEAAS